MAAGQASIQRTLNSLYGLRLARAGGLYGLGCGLNLHVQPRLSQRG
jgi:hypothetical protein